MSIHASFVWSFFFKSANHKTTAEICGKWINRGAGLRLKFQLFIRFTAERSKHLDRLDEIIHAGETAKRALGEKDKGILIDGQKKRKSTKKDKDNLKELKK